MKLKELVKEVLERRVWFNNLNSNWDLAFRAGRIEEQELWIQAMEEQEKQIRNLRSEILRVRVSSKF